MAHLEVEPKPKRPLWLWILIGIILISLAVMLFKNYSGTEPGPGEPADTTKAAFQVSSPITYV